jgi:putative radical SAM enzyme (TIGR03279 family)
MRTERGITIDTVSKDSSANKAGLLPGDLLLSVNAHSLRDPIDFMFYSPEDSLEIRLKREGKNMVLTLVRDTNDLGIDFKPFRVMTCKNNCIFCFVKQLPKGLRKTLYVKDEDYRMSFLYGNYITLSNLSKEDKQRIVGQRLSPLYISVHSTDRAIRNRLLGNPKATDIMKELRFLKDNKIRSNVQIVLCPGHNDGKELQNTLSSLYSLYPYVLSIAVVPVGLTIHRKQIVRPVTKEDAINALSIIEAFQKRFTKKHGNPIVYGADELYLKAEQPFPSLSEYGELHQIENGVGMVPLFLSRAKKLNISRSLQCRKKILTLTGVSFYPFLKKIIEKLSEKERLSIDVVAVENTFFGSQVTVAGLLTGRDVMKTALDCVEGHDTILLPDVVLDDQDRFLDNVTLDDMQEALGIPVNKIVSTPEGLIKGIAEQCADTATG